MPRTRPILPPGVPEDPIPRSFDVRAFIALCGCTGFIATLMVALHASHENLPEHHGGLSEADLERALSMQTARLERYIKRQDDRYDELRRDVDALEAWRRQSTGKGMPFP